MIESMIAFLVLNLYLLQVGFFTIGLFSPKVFEKYVLIYSKLRVVKGKNGATL